MRFPFMDKNFISAIGLSALVMAVWYGYVEKHYVHPAVVAAAAASSRNAAPAAETGEPAPAVHGRIGNGLSNSGAAAPLEDVAGLTSLEFGKAQIKIRPAGAAI